MQVIHDDELAGLAMIPLIVAWQISPTCQIADCAGKTTTIIAFNSDETPGDADSMNIGICEHHYSEAKHTGRFDYTVKV